MLPHRYRNIPVLVIFLAVMASLICPAAASVFKSHADAPAPPQDSGIMGLQQTLRKLRTTARLMHTTAHPDDEDGGMLALHSRGMGATVMLMTLTRGEGGQNRTGSDLFDALGVLRTLELLASDAYYGVEQRFSRVTDFGFSKNAEETFNKWKGRETPLRDIVKAIRIFRPDVVVARFQGAPRDGHGNHQAAGAITPDAFKAAGDPKRFPEQLAQGLQPWTPAKLYVNNVRANEPYTIRLDTGAYDPALGVSFSQFAVEGLSHQLSQGSGGSRLPRGHRYTHYKLADSNVGLGASSDGKETSFFDRIDTTLPGLAGRIGPESGKVPSLRQTLIRIDRAVTEASLNLRPEDPSRIAAPLLEGLKLTNDLIGQVESAALSAAASTDLLTHLKTKKEQFEKAVNLALGVDLEVFVDAQRAENDEPVSLPSTQQTLQMAVPGQTFTLTARIHNGSESTITPETIELNLPPVWQREIIKQNIHAIGRNDFADVQFRVTVPEDAPYTRPYWRRDDPQIESIHAIDEPRYDTLALPPPPVTATARYRLGNATGSVSSVAKIKYVDPMYGQRYRPLVVGPPLSVELQPGTQVVPVGRAAPSEVIVGVRSNVPGRTEAVLRLDAPPGWKVEPRSHPVAFSRDGEFAGLRFMVTPEGLREQRYEIRAIADYKGKQYSESYSVVTRQDLGTFYYYKPGRQRVSAVDVATSGALKVGYVMGAGDEIPAVLKQVGIEVELISPSELATGDLSRFDTVVLGIRAYDVRSDVRDHNKRLLEFVERGGTLVVQYNMNASGFTAGKYTPYPVTATNDRVTVEEAPVEILAPEDSVFNYPNKIGARDFDGWVQERGLYFITKWDERFRPLLSSNDPGEKPLRGGLLRASYGKGTYIYTSYAFFRQLPAGVPGAVRLFVNLLNAGRQAK